MAECKECLHYELCKHNTYQEAKYFGKDMKIYITIDNKIACKFFKPAADVVEVVRCKECKYSRPRNKSEKNIYFEGVLICESCEMEDEPCAVCETDFCSYGEKRSEGK